MIKKIFGLLLSVSLLVGIALTVSAANFQFTKNLYPGLTNNPDVMKLQDLLRSLGFFAPATSTGNYFNITTNSVKKFQVASNITPSNGYFGPLTMAQANRLTGILQNVVVPPTAPPMVEPLNAKFEADKSATSTYYGKIKIYSIGGYSRVNPVNEHIVIRNQSTTTEPISITGFVLVTTSKEEFTIPKGRELLDLSPAQDVDITLNKSGYARIVTGLQNNNINFKENICEGYFDEFSDFNGELLHNCPQPDIRSVSPKLPDHCIQIFESRDSCRTVDPTTIQVAECVAYADAHLNYQGCVKDNVKRDDFYGNNWHIWMQRNRKFLRYIHDNVTLYDPQGKFVDTYSY
ncbi:MAG: peptidoglycan-binding protein [Candidatus Vogelbacteria bacterium]|nr:peptidoglycan-binding protein [Candidatus Vogelbacteria bacterium]